MGPATGSTDIVARCVLKQWAGTVGPCEQPSGIVQNLAPQQQSHDNSLHIAVAQPDVHRSPSMQPSMQLWPAVSLSHERTQVSSLLIQVYPLLVLSAGPREAEGQKQPGYSPSQQG